MSDLKPIDLLNEAHEAFVAIANDHQDGTEIARLMCKKLDEVMPALLSRHTQPEATAPAPIPGLPFADLATPIKEFEARKAAENTKGQP